MKDSKATFDLCEYCCDWAVRFERRSPLAVKDAYPKMMRKVLKHKFGIGKKQARRFIEDACLGNWLKLHETDIERRASAVDYANAILGEVFYSSDRWSWDRVLRTQWLYQRLAERCWRLGDD